MRSLHRMEKVLRRVGDLPAAPAVVNEVLRLADDPVVGMSQVGEVVEKDPGLTAKILRVSNSAYYGMRQHVATVKLALVVLGVREVRNIILGISALEALSNERSQSILSSDFLHHSGTVAALSRRLGEHLKFGFQGEAFVAGLLHDMGKVVLARQLGEEYRYIYNKSGGASETLCALERGTLGFTHADAAAAVATQWNFPKILADAFGLHHYDAEQPLQDAKDPKLAAVIRLANRFAHHDFSSGSEGVFTAQGDLEAWAQLEAAGAPVNQYAQLELAADALAELKSPPPML